jgi:hypothetical protein
VGLVVVPSATRVAVKVFSKAAMASSTGLLKQVRGCRG